MKLSSYGTILGLSCLVMVCLRRKPHVQYHSGTHTFLHIMNELVIQDSKFNFFFTYLPSGHLVGNDSF